ncbi:MULTISPECIES: PRC-barrel domain-containing protein [Paeniglutamicibacter]|uniref:PRC-barrel domain-containing protein n=1 Tax=Paeniglutamicibacter sulfureus TaxID=43666 RepID=A0ABU2BQN3_9MICC|nr:MULTISPECIES: PRC-barrel domain-containing protein [Paeniglutamicibacter]MCV9994058.1 PRC-barrel domain-containing protein [Paeniglutamicibacter sp. ZC-3]MDO2935925.1 PRC-barrel domain-containing protein [Paeniglutamicibacter sulfureus]MDR7360314.1 hypothetical protein [Paeniglutamicibacter sulfureus]
MLNNEDLKPLLETKANVFGSEGEKIGTLGQIYLDDGTDLPHFATVKTGLFGSSENFVPLDDAEISNGQLYVRFTKQFVKDAPNVDPMGHLSPEDEDRLYDYYSQAGLGANRGVTEPETPETPRDQDNLEPVGLNQDTPQGAEEHVHTIGPTSGRPRIRKYVVTEHPVDASASEQAGASYGLSGEHGAYLDGPQTNDVERNGNESLSEGDRSATEDGPEMKRPRSGERMDP